LRFLTHFRFSSFFSARVFDLVVAILLIVMNDTATNFIFNVQ
jgi:hypothetical protein